MGMGLFFETSDKRSVSVKGTFEQKQEKVGE